jgi:hypothetical protein
VAPPAKPPRPKRKPRTAKPRAARAHAANPHAKVT